MLTTASRLHSSVPSCQYTSMDVVGTCDPRSPEAADVTTLLLLAAYEVVYLAPTSFLHAVCAIGSRHLIFVILTSVLRSGRPGYTDSETCQQASAYNQRYQEATQASLQVSASCTASAMARFGGRAPGQISSDISQQPIVASRDKYWKHSLLSVQGSNGCSEAPAWHVLRATVSFAACSALKLFKVVSAA